MSSRTAAQVLGGQKGGLKSAALGTAYRWTTETARKAAVKSWTKRRKFNKRIGTRVGMKTNRRPRLWREPLRQYYAENMTRHITYNLFSGQWYRLGRIVSERAALTALGHLSTVRGFIPDSVTHSPRHSEKA
jgi:aldehyde:ferredoxin oxidoreductase